MEIVSMMNKLGLNVEIESIDAKNGVIKGLKIATSYEMTDATYKVATEAMVALLQQGMMKAIETIEKQESQRVERYEKEAESRAAIDAERLRREKAEADNEELRSQKLKLELEKLKSK